MELRSECARSRFIGVNCAQLPGRHARSAGVRSFTCPPAATNTAAKTRKSRLSAQHEAVLLLIPPAPPHTPRPHRARSVLGRSLQVKADLLASLHRHSSAEAARDEAGREDRAAAVGAGPAPVLRSAVTSTERQLQQHLGW